MLGRAWHWIAEQFPFLIVLLVLAVAFGFLVLEPSHPVRGTLAIAGASLLAAVLRLCLPALRAGLLAVRSRWIDTFFYLLFGGLIIATDLRLKQ